MRQRAVAESDTWAAVEPTVRWVGVRLSPVVPETIKTRIDGLLTQAGDYLGLTPEEYVGLSALSTGFGVTAGAIAHYVVGVGVWLVFVAAAVGCVIPWIQLRSVRDGRYQALSSGLPYAIDLMSLSLGAGLDFHGSIRHVLERGGCNECLNDEFGYILQQMEVGRSRRLALEEFERRADVRVIQEFVRALVLAEDRGSPVSETLDKLAVSSRRSRTIEIERVPERLRAKLVVPSLMLAVTSAGYTMGMAGVAGKSFGSPQAIGKMLSVGGTKGQVRR